MATPQLKLELRTQQQLVMTPALQQAISLLQLNNLELSALLAQEVEQNPLLEMAGENVAAETPAEDAPPVARDVADLIADTPARSAMNPYCKAATAMKARAKATISRKAIMKVASMNGRMSLLGDRLKAAVILIRWITPPRADRCVTIC